MSLARREWLDVRTVTLASLALIAVACVVVRWVLGRQFDEWTGAEWAGAVPPERYLDGFVPMSVALVAALVASDLISGEIASRRIDALALLPVRASRIWWAKFTVLAGVLTLTAVWAFLVQAFTLLSIDGVADAAAFVDSVAETGFGAGAVGAVAAFVASVLLVSSLGLRGLSAALGGVLVFVACAVGGSFALQTMLGRAPLGSPPTELANLALASVAVVFVAASATAFSWGRIHVGRARSVRVAAVTCAVTSGLIATAWAGLASGAGPGRRFSDLEPYVHVSPDGRHVAMQWCNTFGAGCSTRILDVASGVAAEADAGNARFVGWDDDGRARLVRAGGGEFLEVLSCDATTGAVVTRREQTAADYCTEANRRARAQQKAAGTPPTWTRWDIAKRPDDPALWRIYAKDQPSRDVRSVMRPVVMHGPNPRVLVAPDADHLVRLDPVTGDTEALIESTGAFANAAALSWSATRVPMRTPTRRFVVDLDARAIVPLPEDISDPGWPVDGAKGRIWHMRVRDARSGALVDLVSGTRVALRPATTSEPRIASLPDGGVVVVHDDGSAEHFGPSLERIPFTGVSARQESSR